MGPKLRCGAEVSNLNEWMHPRNVFRERPPDFARLAAKYPAFAARCRFSSTGKASLDFKSPEAVRQLSIALLKEEFGLSVHLPADSLVPRVPSRLNYLLWIQDLLSLLPASEERRRGVDIGTGASAIYPLLGSRLFGWSFLASEKDPASAAVAAANVEANGLADSIRVAQAKESSPLSAILEEGQAYDFCMCNPPFFEPGQVVPGQPLLERESSERPLRPPPHSATVAKLSEVCAEGGEVGFVSRLIADSAELGRRLPLYTSLLGRKSSLPPLKAQLARVGATSVVHGTLFQGRTPRWVLAWTFIPGIDLSAVHKASASPEKPSIIHVQCPPGTSEELVQRILRDLDMVSETEEDGSRLCSAFRATWANARRKRRAAKAAAASKIPRTDSESSSHHHFSSPLLSLPLPQPQPLSSPAESQQLRQESSQPHQFDKAQPILRFRLSLHAKDPPVLELEKVFAVNRDHLNQVAQFFRNQLSSFQ